MSAESTVVSVEHQGFNIESVGTPESTIRESLKIPAKDPESDLSKAASELGKKGAAAAAEKRAAKKAETEDVGTPEEKPTEQVEKVEAKPEKEPEVKAEPEEKPEEDLKGRAKLRVEQATRDAAQARREAQQARERAEALERRIAEQERPRQEAPQKADAAPVAEDFEKYEDFVEARSRWAARQEMAHYAREAYVQAQAEQHRRSVQTTVQTFSGKIQEAFKADAALRDRIEPLAQSLVPTFMLSPEERIGASNVLADEIVTSSNPIGILTHFEEHPEDYDRIRTLQHPRDVMREVARIEARLDRATAGTPQSTSQPASKPVSKAPAPVRPVTGAPHIADGQTYREGMSFDEFARNWKAPKR